jgi:CRP/FNR family transcriptional regulator, anaerobic regulatory protein
MDHFSRFSETFLKYRPAEETRLKEITDRFVFRRFEKKSLILKEGSVCREFYFINEGMIRTFVNDDGNEVTTWVALPGTIETSAQSFLRSTPSTTALQAISDCEVLSMNRDDYYYLIRHHAGFNAFAIRMMENFYLRVEDKFYSYLFLSAEARFRKMKTQYPEHFAKVPLKYLASILRIKPETLSRLRRKVK